MAPLLYHSILFVHIACGILVLLCGLLQIALTKGTTFHRYNGRVYFWSITGVILTGFVIGSLVIVFIGLFGYYYALTGYRYALLKNKTHAFFDRVVILCGLFVSIGMLIEGCNFLLERNIPEAIILLLFGALFITNVIPDLLKYVLDMEGKPSKYGKRKWWFEHFGRMYISYIMALTAFSVINNIFRIFILNWILPTVIGTTLIAVTRRVYVKRFAREEITMPEQHILLQVPDLNPDEVSGR